MKKILLIVALLTSLAAPASANEQLNYTLCKVYNGVNRVAFRSYLLQEHMGKTLTITRLQEIGKVAASLHQAPIFVVSPKGQQFTRHPGQYFTQISLRNNKIVDVDPSAGETCPPPGGRVLVDGGVQ